MDNRQLASEFEAVLARDYNIRHSSEVAAAPANSGKNRYSNVLPYDHNRVLLRACSAGVQPASSAASGVPGTAPAPSAPSWSGPSAVPARANGHATECLGAPTTTHPTPATRPGEGAHPDYINASHVVHDDVQEYGFSLRYIACQGPLAATVSDFWRMCWSEGVGGVVMLTNTLERGVTKCHLYFPTQLGGRFALRGGGGAAAAAAAGGALAAAAGRLTDLDQQTGGQTRQQQRQQQQRQQGQGNGAAPGGVGGGGWGSACGCRCQAPSAACVEAVAAVSARQLLGGDLTETRLVLLPSAGDAPSAAHLHHQSPQQQQQQQGGFPTAPVGAQIAPVAVACPREVVHLHYNSWPDHGTPADAAAIRTICDLLRPVRAAGGAVVVHCSAGIGRTGTFCAIDILRHRLDVLTARADQRPGCVPLDAVHAALNLPDVVHSLRRQRGGMVQTIEQYAFCYQALYEEQLAAVGGAGERAGARTGTPPRGGRR